MKENYINALSMNLIERLDYTPYKNKDEEGKGVYNTRFLQKYSRGAYYIVDIEDGDKLNEYEIRQQMENSRNRLMTINEESIFYFFKVFVFNSSADFYKTGEIFSGQLEEAYVKRFLSCFTVNLENGEIKRHFNIPEGTDGIERLLRELFTYDLSEYSSLPDMEALLMKKYRETSIEFKASRPFATYTLITINAALWILMELFSTMAGVRFGNLLIPFGAKFNVLIMAGEYWRLITPVFLHANITHLFFNSYSLYSIGMYVERIYGWKKFVLVYFLSGLTGNIASFAFTSYPQIPGVGASGAIFGLLGAMLYFGVESPKAFKKYFGSNIIIVIVINLALGFSIPGIDNLAHIGGLTGGFLTSGMLKVREGETGSGKRLVFAAVMLILITASLYWGFHSPQNVNLFRSLTNRGI